MTPQKYVGEDIVPVLRQKYDTLDTKIAANTALIGDVDSLLQTLDTGTGV